MDMLYLSNLDHRDSFALLFLELHLKLTKIKVHEVNYDSALKSKFINESQSFHRSFKSFDNVTALLLPNQL